MEFENISLHTLCQNAVGVLKNQIDAKGAHFTLDLPQDLPHVKADANKIIWVVTNLISNALRYTEKEGSIHLSVEQLGPYVHVSVRDNGPGIPYEVQSKIFTNLSDKK